MSDRTELNEYILPRPNEIAIRFTGRQISYRTTTCWLGVAAGEYQGYHANVSRRIFQTVGGKFILRAEYSRIIRHGFLWLSKRVKPLPRFSDTLIFDNFTDLITTLNGLRPKWEVLYEDLVAWGQQHSEYVIEIVL